MICSFLSSVLYLHFSLFRIKFHHFSVSDRTITWCLGKFFQYFLRFLPLLLYVFVQNFQEFVQNRIFFVQKQEEVSVCFSGFFSLRRANFYVFSRPGKEIFLPVFIIFALLPGLSGRKILIFRNEFSVRTNIFSFFREYFPLHPAGIFTFPGLFCTNQTRAHLHARNNILSTLPGFLFLSP